MKFEVFDHTGNGPIPWWVAETEKIELIASYLKQNFNIEQSLFESGVTQNQYKYFKKIHPEFTDYFADCRMFITNKAKSNINEAIVIKGDISVSKWHLETVENQEYKKQLEIKNTEISDDDRLKQLTAEQEYIKYKMEKEEKDG